MTDLPPVGARIRATWKEKDPDAEGVVTGVVTRVLDDYIYLGSKGHYILMEYYDIEILEPPPFDPDAVWLSLDYASRVAGGDVDRSLIFNMQDNFSALNKHLSSGGKLPKAWKDAKR